ncbi:MAG: single-stranded-DNA-specific exonuclease RecJ, partial [Rhodospirillaceae bacterium]|nr:single-stranded-DNA-specific exonuclease RecJ [Rhodospirillaceae bacterium]
MSESRGVVLGVERSLTGKRWEASPADDRLALALSQRHDLSDIVARILVARGVEIDFAEAFLNPSLKSFLPDPALLKGMDEAADRLARAVVGGETIGVFGDYDVDGATSAALLKRFILAVGGNVDIYVPDRLREGYGPNLPALLEMKDAGAGVIVTVDCGITAFDPLAGAADAGIDIVVVDHHVAEPQLPAAVAVVNPNRIDDESGQGQLAAVGVAFLLVVALNRCLRERGYYTTKAEPNLLQWLDLVALGTVCDVVPLTGLNRALVAQGLKVMARRDNIGLRALADVASIDEAPTTYHAGFILGPRVNAGGRVGEASLGARLLTTHDPDEARELAMRLDAWNKERRELEAACLEEAIAQAEDRGLRDGLVYVSADNWHAGVIGIVAGRLKDRYNRPACVVARDQGVGKGSGRSVTGVDLGAAVVAARQLDLLINGGGHPMAAGFSVSVEREAEFATFLSDHIERHVGTEGVVRRLRIDAAVQPEGATTELAIDLARIAPFGAGNPEPRFVLPSARIAKADVVGENHVRCFLSGATGGRLK